MSDPVKEMKARIAELEAAMEHADNKNEALYAKIQSHEANIKLRAEHLERLQAELAKHKSLPTPQDTEGGK